LEKDVGEKSLVPGGSWWNARAKNSEELRSENKRRMTKYIRDHSLRCKGTGEVEHDMEDLIPRQNIYLYDNVDFSWIRWTTFCS
jgi:hypothetical protein